MLLSAAAADAASYEGCLASVTKWQSAGYCRWRPQTCAAAAAVTTTTLTFRVDLHFLSSCMEDDVDFSMQYSMNVISNNSFVLIKLI